MADHTVDVPVYDDGFRWVTTADERLMVEVLGDSEVVVSGNRAGFVGLARRLLALAQDGLPPGYHSHIEDGPGLATGSASLVIEAAEDLSKHPEGDDPGIVVRER